MSSSLYAEKEIEQIIKDAVKAALKDQKEAHDEAIHKLVDGHNLATPPSPLFGTNLTKTSGLSYLWGNQWGESLPRLLQQRLGHPCHSLLVPLLPLLMVVPKLRTHRITSRLLYVPQSISS